jgi:hypothetical protein
MPDLSQSLAEADTLNLTDMAARIEDEIRRQDAFPPAARSKKALVTARAVTRHVVSAAGNLEGCYADLEDTLREGLSGDEFRIQARVSSLLLRACLMSVELAGQLWDRVEQLGLDTQVVTAGREDVSAVRARVLALRPRVDRLAAYASKPVPDIDPAAIERGAEEIRQGKFLTPEQAIERIRQPRA